MIFKAIKEGDKSFVEKWIGNGANVNSLDDDQCISIDFTYLGHDNYWESYIMRATSFTPISLAAFFGEIEIIKLLLHHEADINKTPEGGWPPLCCAAYNGHNDIITLLLKHGADVNPKTSGSHYMPFYYAASKGYTDTMKLLAPKVSDINYKNYRDRTALHIAILNNHYETFDYLLKIGANVNNALFFAAYKGNIQFIRRLVWHGDDIHQVNETGETALHYAVSGGHQEAVSLLLNYGARIQKGNDGSTLLYKALIKKNFHIAELLLSKGDDINQRNYKDKIFGFSLLTHLISKYNNGAIQFLLDNGADPNSVDSKGRVPLIEASTKGVYMVKMLLNNGAKVNIRDQYEQTALFTSGIEETRLLLSNGADVNLQDNNGITPLMKAVQSREHAKANLLLSFNANPDLATHDGQTPLGYACRWKLTECVHVLLENGANVNGNMNGDVPLVCAVKDCKSSIIKLLLLHGACVNKIDQWGFSALDKLAHFSHPDFINIKKLIVACGGENKILSRYSRSTPGSNEARRQSRRRRSPYKKAEGLLATSDLRIALINLFSRDHLDKAKALFKHAPAEMRKETIELIVSQQIKDFRNISVVSKIFYLAAKKRAKQIASVGLDSFSFELVFHSDERFLNPDTLNVLSQFILSPQKNTYDEITILRTLYHWHKEKSMLETSKEKNPLRAKVTQQPHDGEEKRSQTTTTSARPKLKSACGCPPPDDQGSRRTPMHSWSKFDGTSTNEKGWHIPSTPSK